MILSIILQLILLGFLITQLSPATKGPAVPVVLATLQPLAACSKQYVGFTVSKLQFLWNMDRSRTSRWIHPVFYATDFNHGQVPMGVNVADNNKTIWQRVYPLKIPQLSENVGAEKHVRPCTVITWFCDHKCIVLSIDKCISIIQHKGMLYHVVSIFCKQSQNVPNLISWVCHGMPYKFLNQFMFSCYACPIKTSNHPKAQVVGVVALNSTYIYDIIFLSIVIEWVQMMWPKKRDGAAEIGNIWKHGSSGFLDFYLLWILWIGFFILRDDYISY